MWDVLRTVFRSAVCVLKTRRDLALENLALRHQLAVYERQNRKPRLADHDRLIWIGLRRLWPRWQTALRLVQPATVVKWHREGFRAFWRRKSRPSGGRPRIDQEVRQVIRDMWNANPIWGRPRIQSELAKLGITVSDATVRSYRPRRPKPPSQSWRTFLTNHTKDIVAIDFFTIPTVTFRILYVLMIMSHDRRKVVHFNVTDSPSPQWTGQQIIEAFPYDTAPRYLLRDRDGIYGAHFVRRVKSMGIDELLTAPRSPWQKDQSAYCTSFLMCGASFG
jgi:hypothetical protein